MKGCTGSFQQASCVLDFYRKDESPDTTDDSESGLPGTLADVNRTMVGENAAWLQGHFQNFQKQSQRCFGPRTLSAACHL